MAQAYNHVIMPLANERDKETEVLWGIADFEKRFHRKPDALWLPETAVNYPTLQVLIKHGMQYLILSPFQALRVRSFGSKKWTDVSQGRIDCTQPYRCFIKDASGKRLSDQFIDIFFYDGVISHGVSFGDLLRDGNVFCEQFLKASESSKKRPQLIHIATDGETYGHHKKFGDMALAYALKEGFSSRGFEIINYGAFLKRFPPVYEVEIDEGPKGEGTSWSCAHGVDRWKEDCGCSTGGRAGWNQKWRKPLREALDLLRDELSSVFEREGEKIFKDVWEARNGYIEVILDRSPERVKSFFESIGVKGLDEARRIKGLKLLEMQRHALLMYTSCGCFFADLSGLETIQILQYAARAIELGEALTGQGIEAKFVKKLSEAKSNLPEMGDGGKVYRRMVKPRSVTLDKVVNHFAISSLFAGNEKDRKIFSYRVERLNYERMESRDGLLVVGQGRVTSEIIPEPKEFLFGLFRSKKEVFRTWVSENKDLLKFDKLKERCFESLGKSEEDVAKLLSSLLGNRLFTIRDTFKEERQVIFQKLIEDELNEHRRIYAELFDRSKQAVEALAREGLEIPFEIRVAAEVTLSHRLLKEIERLKSDYKLTAESEKIDRIVDEARKFGYHLRGEESLLILNEILREKMGLLRTPEGFNIMDQAERIEEIITFLDRVEKWGFEISKGEAQELMDEMLKEYVGGLEKSWWGNGSEKPFPPNLILLAEKLDFNVERFSKMVNPAASTPRS
jgi:alpha-amylase/alpha-mannosidase (GH57 family)